MDLSLILLQETFAVCKLDSVPPVDWHGVFISLTRTSDEISLVCPVASVPHDCIVHAPWRAFRVAGTLDFSLTGILASISGVLAQCQVSIFAVSTYDTDYILVPAAYINEAISALSAAGYDVTHACG